MTLRACSWCLVVLALVAIDARAQTPASPSPPGTRRHLVAAETTGTIVIDGVLDEAAWAAAETANGFLQGEPDTGKPATEDTDVRVLFDHDTLYVGAFLHDHDGAKAAVLNDIRKDFAAGEQDTFEVIVDTFGDRRNGFMFMTNVDGARADQQVANEGREVNASWDAVWFVRTAKRADGWTVEMAIPFKSLRFTGGTVQHWGINFSRRLRRRNEIDYWSPVPRAFALTRVSLAGDLDRLPALTPGRNLRIKPYVLGQAVRASGVTDYTSDFNAGGDLKYGVTPALTLDLTLLPDFAQAEADEQQVNLTQFSQFFPEKRDFFLENSGTFYVGDTARNNRVNPSPTPDEDLLLFHSRRIGLSSKGAVIPILGGGRLTGQAAGVGLGIITVQTREHDGRPAENYTVMRARRNLGRASDVGAIFMSHQTMGGSDAYNRVYGADATFRLIKAIDWNSYAVHTETPGVTSGDNAWRSSINWEGTFAHFKGGAMSLGDHFNDELGYYRRTGVVKYFVDTGLRPRSAALKAKGIREIHPHITWNYFDDHDGRMVAKRLHSGLSVFFNTGGFTELSVNPAYERIETPFTIHAGDKPIPAGGYGWNEWQWRINTDPSRAASANITLIRGGLWSGTQRTVNAAVTLRAAAKLRATMGVSTTDATLDLPAIHFTTSLWTLRGNYSFSRNMYLDSLLQYDHDQDRFNANVRFNLIHRPLSDLYVVYNEQRVTTPDISVPPGRGLIVKFTEMLAF
ncbi:MAG: DUF5916 domain-containing protein [Vicinamibacterales bacterium]